MEEDLIFIEEKLKEIENNKKLYGEFYKGYTEDYDELIYLAESSGYKEKELELNLELLQMMNGENNNKYNYDNYNYYSKILDLYIQLGRYLEAYKFANKVYDREYILSGGDVLTELIEVYQYIPCLCYKLNDAEGYAESSKNLYNITKDMVDGDLSGDVSYFGEIYFNMGKIFVSLKEYDKSIEYYDKAYYYYELYNKQKRNDKVEEGEATKSLNERLKETAKILEIESKIEFYDAMIEVYNLKGNNEKVEEFIEKKQY